MANGEPELYVAGQSVIEVTGLILKDNEGGRIKYIPFLEVSALI